MPYVVVFLVATAAGVGVGLLTLRQGRLAPANPEAWSGAYREEVSATAETGGTGKRRMPSDPNPHTRKIGAAGLLGVILGAAGLIALLAYIAWTAVNGIFSVPQH